MKLSDVATTAQVVFINDRTADWISSDEDDDDGPTVTIRETEHDDDYDFEDVEIDLSEKNWVELMPINPTDHDPGELVRIEFYMLRPMTPQDMEEQ